MNGIHPTIAACLAPFIPPPRHPGWRIAAEAFARCDPACETCAHLHSDINLHPYGEGGAVESYSECQLGQRASDKPEACPAYQIHLQSNQSDTGEHHE